MKTKTINLYKFEELTAEQYKEYESILEDFLNSLEEIFIYDTELKEYD